MATITLNIPDAVVTRVVLALSDSIGFGDAPTASHAKEAVVMYIKHIVQSYETTTNAPVQPDIT